MPESSRTKTTRREWLGAATLTTLGCAIGARVAYKNLTFEPETLIASPSSPQPEEPEIFETQPQLKKPPVEPQLVTPAQSQPASYEEFLTQFNFRYLTAQEIITPHRRSLNGIDNCLPPRELWENMPASLRVADEIRHRLGRPLKLITSAYRSPAYNKQCGGARNSFHTKNLALDLVFEASPRRAFAIAKQLRKEGFFQGGIGLYRGFIHIDTRGTNATWRA